MGSMNIWKPVATNLVEEMARRQVNIDRHYLFTYVDTIQAALTTTNHSEFSSVINDWNTFRGSKELTFTALKHAMEQVATNAFVCVWTDEIGNSGFKGNNQQRNLFYGHHQTNNKIIGPKIQ